MAQATAPVDVKPAGSSPRQRVKLILSYLALILLTLVFAAPLLWMLSTSFKTNPEAIRWPLTWIPREFTLQGYSEIFNTTSQTPVLRWLINSLISAFAHTALVLATAAPAAYALARMHFRGKRIMFAIIISTLFIPHIILIIPNYLIVDMFGWLDTLLAVIVPSVPTALYLFLLRQFFVSLPRELEEAALLDGANRYQIFLRIILPLSKAPLATVAVLSFLQNWNDLLWPVYVLFSPQNLTLQPGLGRLQGAYETEYPIIMAGGVLASIPVLIVFIFAQRYIIEGISRSGVKG
ncbi:MAG TPA: carbohydrate ABC transporter permease [Rubrobacteraceae bacterium]|nr:carbohydrate ABC transporter permease [Rubrobacteraceae bacterium]